ncbi:MAG: QueT transporter family protein [Clostridia bacterium]|nr:QueT transporter family protein [Clostridia bacterium]
MKTSTKRLCRAGVIAALYTTLTYAFAPVAFGSLQIRPAEALCILPLFFPEAIPALYVGCLLANLTSPFLLYDLLLGGGATLLGALGTYLVGKYVQNSKLKVFLGGLSPIFFNTLIIPFIIVVLCGGVAAGETVFSAYCLTALSIFLSESLCVFGLGIPLYKFFEKRQKL